MVQPFSAPGTVQSIATTRTDSQAELDVSWELLRGFLAVAAARTFGEAAVRQRLSVSAVSQQMKALERALQLRLFERVGRNARLTADGRRLQERLAAPKHAIDEALRELHGRHGAVEGEVAIGSPRAFGAKWLRPRLVKLLAAHEGLSLTVRFDVPSVLERQLADGALDLCILVRPSELPGLSTTPIATERFVAVASPAYARKLPRLEEARYLVFDDDLPMFTPWFRAQHGRSAKPKPRIAAKVASLDELRALAEAGAGVAVLPDYFVEDLRGLVTLETKGRPATNTLFLAWRQHAVETARFVAVREALSK
jgi:DNA-binding transcriptional LysR family regulator